MLTFSEYKTKVNAALAPFNRKESDLELKESYKDYQACAEVLGEPSIIAERDDDGEVRVRLYSPSISAPEAATAGN